MEVAFCPNCGKTTGHKRALGAGTIIGGFVTGGVSLLGIPFYGKRCVICGLTVEQAVNAKQHEANANAQQAVSSKVTATDQAQGWLVLLGFVLLLMLAARGCS